MSNLSRTAVLFSTAILGGMLLTTSITSVATVAYAAETTQTAVTTNPVLGLKPGVYNVKAFNYKTGTSYTPGETPIPGRDGNESSIASYFSDTQQVTINRDGSATVVFQLNPDKKTSATVDRYQVGPNLLDATFDESAYTYTITLPASQLNGVVDTVVKYTPVGIPPEYLSMIKPVSVDLYFVWSTAQKINDVPADSNPSETTTPEEPVTPETPTDPIVKPSGKSLSEGVYQIPISNYKTGTTTASSMNSYLKTPATITVKNNQATIDIETSSASIMGMMSNYRFNDVKATATGNHWLVTLPVADLNKTIATSMVISVNGTVIEQPKADMVFDVEKAVRLGDVPTESQPTTPVTPEKPASDKPASTPDTSSVVEQYSTHALNILQADKNEKSMAANYMLDTVKLTKNADGTYYAYLTTHTPAMMGQNPIRFNDAKHAAELMSTNLVNGYYQSVFRLTLSESELTTPISTHIHVQFTSPLVYDENYEIRLVIGDQLSSNASVNNQNELTDTVIVPRETATTATTFEPAPVPFTTVASSVPMAPTPLAVTHPISSPQTASTSELATSDKAIKLTPAEKQTVSKNKNDKSTSKPSQSDAPKHSKITRATMITAGVVITAAVGFVGASLALNIFKHQ
ncbi:MAG: NEAT domain-containing protein [Weissella confusa]|nr:NEAT domain-containing protein [Weissella confusa]